jgi:hypothetical protein
MRISVYQAKKMGVWNKIPSNVQQKILDRQERKPVNILDPQRALFSAVKAKVPEAKWEVKGLVPGRKFRADIFIPSSNIQPSIPTFSGVTPPYRSLSPITGPRSA